MNTLQDRVDQGEEVVVYGSSRIGGYFNAVNEVFTIVDIKQDHGDAYLATSPTLSGVVVFDNDCTHNDEEMKTLYDEDGETLDPSNENAIIRFVGPDGESYGEDAGILITTLPQKLILSKFGSKV